MGDGPHGQPRKTMGKHAKRRKILRRAKFQRQLMILLHNHEEFHDRRSGACVWSIGLETLNAIKYEERQRNGI